MIGSHPAPPSLWSAGLRMRCPRCGEGKLFAGYLKVVEHCGSCHLALAKNDSGDGPAVFLIFILGAIAFPLIFLLNEWFEGWPYWVPVLIISALVMGLALLMLRPAKALVLALQYRHRPEDYEDD